VQPLTNDRWGLASNCFVCEPGNESGLRIPFAHDEEADEVVAGFTLDDRFSGAPSYVHGGVLLAVLDEAMAWATIAVANRWAVTGETTTRFEQPVLVGRPYRVRARIDAAQGDARLLTSAEILDDDTVCATARATFVVLGETQLAEAAGVAADDLPDGLARPS